MNKQVSIAIENAIRAFIEKVVLSGGDVYIALRYAVCLWNMCELCGCSMEQILDKGQICKNFLRRINEIPGIQPQFVRLHETALKEYRKYMRKPGNENRKKLKDSVALPNSVTLPANAHEDETWYPRIYVDDIKKFRKLIRGLNDESEGMLKSDKWIFRGQGNAKWSLETSLDRIFHDKRCGDVLKQYENDSMWVFSREAYKDLEYRDFKGLNLLALMQHYGCKTRLLDFSLSPYVALYMAIEQYESVENQSCGSSLALWAINLKRLCKLRNDSSWMHIVKYEYENGNSIVESLVDGCQPGVTVVFPTINNHRLSVQDALFLMQNSLQYSFETNLCARFRMGHFTYKEQEISSIAVIRKYLQGGVCKFIINSDKIDEMRQLLKDANVTARTVYPDLTGLGKYVAGLAKNDRAI